MLQAAGIAGVGLWADRLVNWTSPQIARELRPTGLKVASVGAVGGFTRHNGYTFDDAVQDGFDRIELARVLRAPVVRVISGPTAGHLNKHARRLLLDGIRALLPAAQSAGVRLALQPISSPDLDWTFLQTLEAAESVLSEVNHPALGIAIGVGHLSRTERLLERVAHLSPWIASVQLADALPRSQAYDQRLPGDGQLPLREFISVLESAEYRGWYELEVWSRDLWKLNSETLMRLCLESLGCLVPASTPVDA
jgi:sugar phosphate isomerase/epimerase